MLCIQFAINEICSLKAASLLLNVIINISDLQTFQYRNV